MSLDSGSMASTARGVRVTIDILPPSRRVRAQKERDTGQVVVLRRSVNTSANPEQARVLQFVGDLVLSIACTTRAESGLSQMKQASQGLGKAVFIVGLHRLEEAVAGLKRENEQLRQGLHRARGFRIYILTCWRLPIIC